MRITTVSGVILLFATYGYTAPSVSSVTQNISHGGSISIVGTDFGTKSAPAPLVWDDGTSNTTIDTYYDHYLPTNAQQGSDYNMQYRAVGYRDVDGPHSRSDYYLTGAHAVEVSVGTYTSGLNVGLGVNLTNYDHYISYYYRIDPDFDDENNASQDDNMKEISLSNTQENFYPSYGFGYVDWCNNYVPDNLQTGDVRLSVTDWTNCGYYKCTESGSSSDLDHNSPISDWIRMEWRNKVDSGTGKPVMSLTTYPDNITTDTNYYGNEITTYEYASGEYCGQPDDSDLAFVGIGGFARVPRVNEGINSFRYFSDVYIDDTRSRVVLANNSTYASATIIEPQPPTAWNANGQSITATVNLGQLSSSGTAYLFVFDSDDEANATGYAVTVGGASRGFAAQGVTIQ